MKEFSYQGTDRRGRAVTGTTAAENAQEVEAQLLKFGFSNIQIEATGARPQAEETKKAAAEKLPDDYVQKLIDGDIAIEQPATEEEAEEDEWRRAEVYAKVARRRRRENFALAIALVVIGLAAIYYIFEKATAITAPQPTIIMRSGSQMLSFKDVYVKGNELFFTIFSREWNGNVRVDFKAWDPFDEQIDFGTARLGHIGEHYGGSSEKTSAFKLKKSRFYERIEILVSGDEGK
jgi:hypothetical protein